MGIKDQKQRYKSDRRNQFPEAAKLLSNLVCPHMHFLKDFSGFTPQGAFFNPCIPRNTELLFIPERAPFLPYGTSIYDVLTYGVGG